MPEGPSLVILKEEVQAFEGLKIVEVSGNSKEDIQRLKGQKIIEFKTWGKHFLICFKKFTLRIHFLLFGKYTINSTRDASPRLSLTFKSGHINFYTCSVKFIDEPLDDFYDWKADVLNDEIKKHSLTARIQKSGKKLFLLTFFFDVTTNKIIGMSAPAAEGPSAGQ